MNINPVVIVGCVFAIAVVTLLVRKRIRLGPTYSVTARDIPEIIRQLDRSSQDGHFAVLTFVPPGSRDGMAVNLQYSIESGTVGMDWVLLGSRNIADRDKVCAFASQLGYRLGEHQMNNVRYLRITGSGVSELGTEIIQDFYRVGPGTKLDMITEGFEWQSQ